jgi:hypothetical protein
MTTIRKIVTSQVDGNDANSTNDNEIRPYGETSFYVDSSNAGKLVLSIFDGQRTHLKSKVVGPGVLYGSNADSGDGYGFDTIKLIPDATLHYNDGNYGNDQYLIVDPTSPNHIHIRAGGTQDASTAELFLGGELTNVKVSDSSDSVTIRTSDTSGGSAIPKEWIFDNTGKLSFPIFGAIETVGMGWFGITNGESGGPISIVQKSINVAHTGQYLSDITLSNGNDWTTGDVRISTSDLTAETSHQWTFGSDGTLTLPGTAEITDTADVQDAGTKITVPLNAAGDTVDYVGGASVIEIPKNADTNQVQAGWIIIFPDSTQRTVTGVLDGVLYWSVQYAEANPGLGAGTYPLDIQSPDYTVASAGAITLTKTGHSWSFDSDGKITMGAGVTIDTEGIASQGDFNLTLPGTNSLTPQQFKFTDEGGEGAIRFPNGTYTIGNQISAPTDDTIELKTFYRQTISAEAIAGSSQDLLVVDISANDDITVVDTSWEINAGSEIAPQWLPVVSTDVVPGDICSIDVPGFEFIAGFTYTFRNNSPTVYDWTFNPAGTLTAPGGAILTNETAPLGEGTYRELAIELPTPDELNEKRWVFSNDGNLSIDGKITHRTTTAEINLNAYSGNVLEMATYDSADATRLTLATDQITLVTNHNISIGAGLGNTPLYQAYDQAEALFASARDADAAAVAPTVRSWDGDLSFMAYDKIMAFVGAGGTPAVPVELAQLALTAKMAQQAAQTALYQSYVKVTAVDKYWFFNANGGLTLPNGSVIKDNSDYAVAFGASAGETNQGASGIAIGNQAGQNSQSNNSIAIGALSGNTNQGTSAVAIGPVSGLENQASGAVAVGANSGQSSQGASAVAVGPSAGNDSQGAYAVAIGYLAGYTDQHANSIILNASGSVLNSDGADRLYVNPIRSDSTQNNVLLYNTTSKEVTYSTLKGGGSWTVTTGTNTYSFTVDAGATYVMWVRGTTDNGVISWNATVTITNTNLPAVGTSGAFVYTGGGTMLDFTAVPDRITTPTSGGVSRLATILGAPSTTFEFGINNASGASVTVYWGWTKI